jgi:hypothetical protein
VARLLFASDNSEAVCATTVLAIALTTAIAREVVRRVPELAIACVANQQPDVRQKQQRGVSRQPRAVRLAHHPGNAAVRRPAARQLSAWRCSSVDGRAEVTAFRLALAAEPDRG